MEQKKSLTELTEERKNLLDRLNSGVPIIQGSLAKVGVTCGKENCRCAKGEKHISHILTKKVRGKTKSLYVPKNMVEEVNQWVKEHRRIKKVLKEISEISEKIIKPKSKENRDENNKYRN